VLTRYLGRPYEKRDLARLARRVDAGRLLALPDFKRYKNLVEMLLDR